MIVIKDLKKAFGDHVVLPCVNMEIKEREVVVIIGPSGSGKSTLLRSITHLEQPTAGKIIIAGEEVDDNTNIDKIRAEVGMVFQHFNLFENMTVLQNLTLAPIQVRKMSKVKVMRQPTASATLIFDFEVAASEFLIKNLTDGEIYASLERDATKEQSVLIPAQTAQVLQYGSYGGGKSNLVQIIPTATSEKGVEVQCLKW